MCIQSENLLPVVFWPDFWPVFWLARHRVLSRPGEDRNLLEQALCLSCLTVGSLVHKSGTDEPVQGQVMGLHR